MKFLTGSAMATAVMLAAIGVLCVRAAHANATLIENVHGYTLAGEQLQRLSALVIDGGKVVRTGDAAYAQHQEKTIGSLEPGKWADFILIDRDLFQIPPGDIWKIKVEQTWVGGRRVY